MKMFSQEDDILAEIGVLLKIQSKSRKSKDCIFDMCGIPEVKAHDLLVFTNLNPKDHCL